MDGHSDARATHASAQQCPACSGIVARLTNVEKDTTDQWTAINQIRNRLPVWATAMISFLTFVIGILATLVAVTGK